MIHALRWILVNCPEGQVTIRSDSMYALHISDGSWSAKANKQLALLSQQLWQEASQIVDLNSAHVKAHSGHRWNERADLLLSWANEDDVSFAIRRPGQR